MAFDKPTRNRLAAFVAEARRLITDEFTQQFQSLYGISDASLTELLQLTHLDDAGLAVAGLLRERIDYLVKTHPEDKAGLKAAVDRLAREQAFTVLNRLAAVRMAEKRGLIAESVGNGYQSKGFKVFEQVARSGLGEIYQRYRRYLFCLFDELAIDLGVLFDRRSPQGLLFPRENTLLDLLNLLNGPELEPLWQEDETIGWIYQYYNDPAERKKMREESAAPRNSRELAVRNQFFTPRYVVEFLTDNTLGRIWYEMTRGETRLAEQCSYLVRRPTEIFLGPEETAPELPEQEGLSQEELLRQPVYIPHRVLKDPRQLRMLDPACGSMHFGLYAFDLYEVIYEEAWDRGMESLRADFPKREALLREIPRLIIEHNIHGIDIDPRAVQIAGLSLWLRAQRSWQQQRLPARQRPQIRRSNIVCAEPMPGDMAMLREFIVSQFAPEEQPAFTFLLERVFDRMTLAGEAGSLLKIEEEISEAVREAKGLWKKGPQYEQGNLFAEALPKNPQQLRLDLSGIPDEHFWGTAEDRIYEALRAYADQAESDSYQRRLFADDAAHGFAFIDLCRKRYDVVVMNPPFGLAPRKIFEHLKAVYQDTYVDLYGCFVARGVEFSPAGFVGAITSRAFLMTKKLTRWRENQLIPSVDLILDFGVGVMDNAFVEAAAYTLQSSGSTKPIVAVNRRHAPIKDQPVCFDRDEEIFVVPRTEIYSLPGQKLLYQLPFTVFSLLREKPTFEPTIGTARDGMRTFDDFRFVRLRWEVPSASIGENESWEPLAKGGEHAKYYSDLHLLVKWNKDGKELSEVNIQINGQVAQSRQASEYYRRKGATYSKRSVKGFSARALPSGCIIGTKGPAVLSESEVEPAYIVGWLNSSLVVGLIHIQANAYEFNTGIIKNFPWRYPHNAEDLATLTTQTILKVREFKGLEETNSIFTPPVAEAQPNLAAHMEDLQREALQAVRNCQESWDETMGKLYGIYRLNIDEEAADESDDPSEEGSEDENEGVNDWRTDSASTLVSQLIGHAVGRWDIRYATGEQPAPELPDPFASLPTCPPGMLQGDDGLPLSPEAGRQLHAAGHYPLNIAWDGIVVDDPGHPFDLEHRLRDVFTVLWHDRAEAIEQEACEILGVKSLPDYFRKPSGFFADHLKRYSKSRRQAPIYWPLSSAKGSYTLWIYYHRLSDQTLHTALADFVDPKIKDVRAEISLLRESNNKRSRLEEGVASENGKNRTLSRL